MGAREPAPRPHLDNRRGVGASFGPCLPARSVDAAGADAARPNRGPAAVPVRGKVMPWISSTTSLGRSHTIPGWASSQRCSRSPSPARRRRPAGRGVRRPRPVLEARAVRGRSVSGARSSHARGILRGVIVWFRGAGRMVPGGSRSPEGGAPEVLGRKAPARLQNGLFAAARRQLEATGRQRNEDGPRSQRPRARRAARSLPCRGGGRRTAPVTASAARGEAVEVRRDERA